MVQSADNDNELLSLCLDGDGLAFGKLVNKYQVAMYNTVLNIVQDPDDAKDVLQRSFIKAWENLGSFNAKHRFFSWMYRIVINESLNNARNRKKMFAIGSGPDDSADPHDSLVEKETKQRLSFAIKQLTPEYRAVILLRHFDELSYAEMAQVLGIEEKTVKSRLYSARLQLREAMNQ